MATCTESIIVSYTNLLLPGGERGGTTALEEDAEAEEEEDAVGRVDGGEMVRLALGGGGGPLGRLVVETTLQKKKVQTVPAGIGTSLIPKPHPP